MLNFAKKQKKMNNVTHLFFNNAQDEVGSIPQETVKATINAVDAQARLNGTSCFIIDFDSHELLYRSDKLIYVDEATSKDKKRECVNPYWSLISEETLEFLISIRNNYLLIDNELIREDYATHISTIDYPIFIRNKEFYINQKFTPLYLREDGITKIGLFTISNSNRNRFESMIITSSGRRWKYDCEKKEYQEFDLGVTLSLVEKAILQRAQKGLTSEEIAKSLYISINTVKTHRMRIFKKLGVESINEALTIVGNYQLL